MDDLKNDIKVEFIAPTRWWKRAKWKLLESYTSNNGKVTVPAGFVTDGASIPFVFRWLFSPTGKYFGAAIIHDYLLVSQQGWNRANAEFEFEMKFLCVSLWRRNLILGAVNLWRAVSRIF